MINLPLMDFPQVEEYLDKEKEESKLNLSLRASSNAPAKLAQQKAEIVK